MDLKEKVAIVTGGGTGIGRATSLALARQGAVVAVNYARSQAEAEETAGEIVAAGGRALAVQADVSDEGAVREMAERVAAELGGIDLLVNNAGTTRYIDLA